MVKVPPSPPLGPPPPPELKRVLLLTQRQWIGLPLLFLISVLGLAGLLGGHSSYRHVTSTALDVHVEYPDRIHYRTAGSIRVTVQNLTSATMDTIHVAYDTTYMEAFTSVHGVPSMSQAYVIPLLQVAPHEQRLAVTEVTGNAIGWHRGALTITTRSDTVRLSLFTSVFP